MTIRNVNHLRTALVMAPLTQVMPREPVTYPIYAIGSNTRNALIAILDRVELAHRLLDERVTAGSAGDAWTVVASQALAELDEFIVGNNE